MRFDTRLDGDNVRVYHDDDTVRAVDAITEPGKLTISSWIRVPKSDDTAEDLGNDDGFLFEGDEPEWSFAYQVCLTGADDLDSDRCTRPVPSSGDF